MNFGASQCIGMILKTEKGLAVGYKKRAVATLSEELLFKPGEITLLLGLNGQGKRH